MSAGKEIQLNAAAVQKLARFEAELKPESPETGSLSPKILGYGEMSTVFCFSDPDLAGLAFKRMAVFETESELAPYEKNFREYNAALNGLGVETPDYGTARGVRNKKPILYAFQRMVNPARIGHKYIHTASLSESAALFQQILEKFGRVFEHNKNHRPAFELGLDGQISNWALTDDGALVYLDTSTPLMRDHGIEQLDPELFLRVCPSYLVWIIRLFFLKDVLNRYYDLRLVIIDLLGNLYKEKKQDLVPVLLPAANEFLRKFPDQTPVQEREIQAYYAEDARIWSIFLAFRKLERFVKTRIQRKEYPLILPGHIDR
jgi:hypothetical protein